MAPPAYPNTVRTPCALSTSQMISPPVRSPFGSACQSIPIVVAALVFISPPPRRFAPDGGQKKGPLPEGSGPVAHLAGTSMHRAVPVAGPLRGSYHYD